MPKSNINKVIVCVAHERTLYKQNYNIEIKQKSEKFAGIFFNECLEDIDEETIYGFLSSDNNFLNDSVIDEIIKQFDYHELVQVVYSDYILQDEKLSYYQYLPAFHPNLLNYTQQFINVPLFVKGIVLKKYNARFHPNLQHLVLHAFFLNICRKAFAIHIPKPLFTRIGNRNIDVSDEIKFIKQWPIYEI